MDMEINGYWHGTGLTQWGGVLIGGYVEITLVLLRFALGVANDGDCVCVYLGPFEIQFWRKNISDVWDGQTKGREDR